MENTPREIAEEPVLLSWDMPGGRRWFVLLLLACGITGVVVLGAIVFRSLSSNIPLGLVTSAVCQTFISWAFLLPIANTGTELRCTGSHMAVKVVVGQRTTLSWDDVRRLRRGRFGFTVADWIRSSLYLPVPPDVRDGLIAILREKSNVRIIGFDSEEG